MPKIFITGDIHQSIDISKLTSRHFPIGNSLTKEDIIIILGDAGLVWDNSKEDMYWRKWLNDKPWTTFCILGNHEAYPLIYQLPKVTFMGNTVYKVEDSIFYAETGNIYNIYGYKCLAINGADSHDKQYRKENVSWWKEEQITEKDVQKALSSLKDNKIDYVFSHTGGTEVCTTLGYAPTKSDFMLDTILNSIQGDFKHFCGHYHTNTCINNYTKVLYKDIILLHNTDDEIDDNSLCSISNEINLGKDIILKID